MISSTAVSMASPQLMRTQPGSSPLGFVRFMGYLTRSGWYSACIASRPFEQQLPCELMAVLSPSTLMTRPFRTLTQMGHSIFPQARQWLLILSTPVASASLSAALAFSRPTSVPGASDAARAALSPTS